MSGYRPLKYKDRPRQLRRIAKQFKMEFHLEDPYGTEVLLYDFHLFKRGRNRELTNLLRYVDEFMEVDIRIFDYKYTRGYGKNRRSYYQTVFFVKSKFLSLPEMLMKPENFFHRIGEYLNLKKDIDFEEFPKFSKQYWLVGLDEEYIRVKFNEQVLHFFSKEKNWHLEGLNYFMLFYQDRKILHPKNVRQLYHKGVRLHDMFKDE